MGVNAGFDWKSTSIGKLTSIGKSTSFAQAGQKPKVEIQNLHSHPLHKLKFTAQKPHTHTHIHLKSTSIGSIRKLTSIAQAEIHDRNQKLKETKPVCGLSNGTP
jgi:hypothetical protein